ncbi:hypothetical protein HZZ13_25850 [Bradyrhizobium sp. CNPSo 4010]|uniref:DUF5681 domain-containing protein n=1 Tax=Bradyrhizobium agreste TaxID=2751811 RepID=A0ABS0PVF0_9BRAD|nr:DUF5681 domain-containing protein [Bradyrhizobium agreste]MBH5401181.1 hypothetical protein [Bradyrhizobium agreste]
MVKRIRPADLRADSGGVGYGKPPKHSQFKPGQSGNPKGRPKGTRNFKSDVRATLQSPVKITKNGRVRNVTTQRAILETMRVQGLKGNQRANEQLVRLGEKYNDTSSAIDAALEADDQAILDAYVRRKSEVYAS